jgi:hypothetical protein
MAAIDVEGLTQPFGTIEALGGISFAVELHGTARPRITWARS